MQEIRSQTGFKVSRFHFIDALKKKAYGILSSCCSFLIKGSFLQKKIKQLQYSRLDDLKSLKLMFDQIEDCITREKVSSDVMHEQAELIQDAMEGVKNLFEAYYGRNDDEGRAYRHDLLEAVSVATREGRMKGWLALQDVRVSRIKAKPLSQVARSSIRSYQTPLFKMEHLEEATRLMEEKFGHRNPPPLLSEIVKDEQLGSLLEVEMMKMAAATERLYKHVPTYIIKFGGRVTTNILGRRYKQRLPEGPYKVYKIMKFFKEMYISPEVEINGELYAYSEAFKRSLRDEETLDKAFQRSLRADITEMLLADQRRAREEITSLVGSDKAPVISNAFCRLRMFGFSKGSVSDKFPIVGKVLNENEENQKDILRSKPYKGRFLFSVKNMLGNEDDVDIYDQRLDHLEVGSSSEHLYRTFLSRAIDREDGTMVVQRLAASDIHHYFEPVGGRILSVSEACEELARRAEVSGNSDEVAMLQSLQKKFLEQERVSGKKGSVEIRGTYYSVSTIATKHVSPLSQNDRKVSMVKHADGSIAIHTFIGAAAVNNVALIAEAKGYEVGHERGFMAFGNDDRGKRSEWPRAFSKKDVDRVIKDRRDREEDTSIILNDEQEAIDAGEKRGQFSIGGSTVVSIYFGKDFVPTEAMARSMNTFQYREKKRKSSLRSFEIESSMGAVIGVPAQFAVMKALEGFFGGGLDGFITSKIAEGYDNNAIVESIFDHVRGARMLFQPKTPQQKFHNELIIMAHNEEKDVSEAVASVIANVKRKIESLRF